MLSIWGIKKIRKENQQGSKNLGDDLKDASHANHLKCRNTLNSVLIGHI